MSTTFSDPVIINATATVGGDLDVLSNDTTLGPETYSQPTFTPSHADWSADGDFSLAGALPAYAATGIGMGDLWQEPENLAQPMVVGRYRLTWTLQNVTVGHDIVCQVRGDGLLGEIAVVNGENTLEFRFPGGYPPYFHCEGTTGGFDVVSVSLKEIPGGRVLVENTFTVEGPASFENTLTVGNAENAGGGLSALGSQLIVTAEMTKAMRVESSGATPLSDAVLVVESNSHTGINVLAPDASNVGVYLGTPSQNYVAAFGYSGMVEKVTIGSNYVKRVDLLMGGEPKITLATNGNVGIGATSPASSAALEVASTTGAVLLPRMTSTERDALSAANGMLIYNTTTNKFQGYENGAWTNLV